MEAMAPPLRLYVWGPAFGLASVDAECLAAIAFFRHALEPREYELIATSPSAIPTSHLPALHDLRSGKWASGYQDVLDLLHTTPPTKRSGHLAPAPAVADDVAHSAFLAAHAAPLLALSLYVSSANWSGATRPAFSDLLPFPLGWTEPPARRRIMARRAEHLGFSSLDTDRDDPEGADSAAKSFIPARLRPRRRQGVSAALTPEAKARIRLDAAAAEVLEVLTAAVGGGGDDEGAGGCMCGPWAGPQVSEHAAGAHEKRTRTSGGRAPSAFECLAFGYLALMVEPDLPRPWLHDIMCQRYPHLTTFVTDARLAWFPPSSAIASSSHLCGLPWVADAEAVSPTGRATRFASGALAAVPGGVGEHWAAWARGRRERRLDSEATSGEDGGNGNKGNWLLRPADHDLVLAVGSSVVGASVLAAAAVLFRGLQPFGNAVQRFERERVAWGAAGAMWLSAGVASNWARA